MKMLYPFLKQQHEINIQQFLPGHYMILDNNQLSNSEHWSFKPENKFIQYFYRHSYYENTNLLERPPPQKKWTIVKKFVLRYLIL